MENMELARMTLKEITTFPESFDMKYWGFTDTSCNTISCIAGRVMLLCGYELTAFESYLRADGSRPGEYGREAQLLLGMTDQERFLAPGVPAFRRVFYYREGLFCPNDLFIDVSHGLERFRSLVEAS